MQGSAMAKGGETNSGCVGVFGILLVIGLIASIPMEVWIGLSGLIVTGVLVWAVLKALPVLEAKRARRTAAAAQRRRDEEAARQRQRVVDLGEMNVGRIDSALAAVQQVADSRAAREGWLGDVDFSVDIQGITDTYARAQQMRRVTWELQALSSPTADDRRLLSEAHATATQLEAAATARVDLILRCALEAQSIDESLRREDEQAQTAAAREALHRELSTLLYGVGAAPSAEAADSAADRVMARVAGYREIKQQITLARGLPVG